MLSLSRAVLASLALLAVAPAGAQTTPPADPATAAPVTGAAAWERLKGNTISGKAGGDSFSEYFEPGGGVRYVDKDGKSTGTWSVQDAKVCMVFPDDDDRSCSVFTVTGPGGSAIDDDGTTTRFTIEPGNSKGL